MRPPLAGRDAVVASLEVAGGALSLGFRGAFFALETSSHWEMVPVNDQVSR